MATWVMCFVPSYVEVFLEAHDEVKEEVKKKKATKLNKTSGWSSELSTNTNFLLNWNDHSDIISIIDYIRNIGRTLSEQFYL